jgi:hypothetical protein
LAVCPNCNHRYYINTNRIQNPKGVKYE